MIELRPQEGPQEQFLSSSADIVIYGGAAGGGKSFAILLEPLRHVDNKNFGAVIFRRTMPMITKEGSLWDTANKIYPLLGAKPIKSPSMHFVFPSGAKITMSHLQYEDTVYDWHGSQIPCMIFDELCQFTEKQFFYMMTRSRSAVGVNVRPYVRASCNPDPDSFVADLISWWIDQDTGYPIKERSGVIRYFVRMNDEIHWGDSKDELIEKYGYINDLGLQECEPISFTFIPSSVYDNKLLLKENPGYIASIKAQDEVTQAQLLGGNWKIRPAAGLYFKAQQAPIVDVIPGKISAICRSWDLAATEETPQNKSPDKSAGTLMARLDSGKFIILDAKGACLSASAVRQMIHSTANEDRINYKCNTLTIPQDPGQAGKEQAQSYVRFLSGFTVKTHTVSGSKIKRAEPFAAQWQQGNVMLLRGDWNKIFVNELVGFPDALHDDFVDSAADAFNDVCKFRDWGAFID
ncbi:phage terminase large subunit [Pectinatus frisingensis]|uniref:phage terminase large subunit n=1 Tax=Pectinatus frisingensis TaxID=865 RepID=UPI001E5E1FBD|nr:phage terminase large subunit [Pectinatus frisingensis]